MTAKRALSWVRFANISTGVSAFYAFKRPYRRMFSGPGRALRPIRTCGGGYCSLQCAVEPAHLSIATRESTAADGTNTEAGDLKPTFTPRSLHESFELNHQCKFATSRAGGRLKTVLGRAPAQ